MSAKPPDDKRLQGAVAARHRARRRTVVLQVPGNAADTVPCERLLAFCSVSRMESTGGQSLGFQGSKEPLYNEIKK